MLFSKEDKILIKNLLDLRDYNAKHLARKFSSKSWNIGSVYIYKWLQKLRITGSVDDCPISATADDAKQHG